ncbi:SDR family oxidoreductase [Sulfoacidibacillus thermotolerans]|uniref:3-oxoacyl-ACP reductase n=1 Tax=Sulfoacidibacillus thermotolerans TaxID=1765684 RepID=A0A2U3D6Z0_SULT2|nr:SDR family oxidoreductase [Sulfoacidibacillus thermotolerans]PWI57038.1 3-oxoacyl-ACP reductase [Sulfoacidibacillus thermotolerans]
MDLGLQDKRAIVTAASRGLGRAIATELIQEGCRVVISSRNVKVLEETKKDLMTKTGIDPSRLYAIPADVTKENDIAQLIAKSAQILGGIDLLITNAGGPPAGTFEQLSDEQWLFAVNQNLLSVVRLIRESLPYLKKQRGGKILNVSSVSVKEPIPNLILSNTVRTATMAMLKTLAREVAKDNIQILNLAPGRIHTDRVQWLDEQRAVREQRTIEEVRLDEQSHIPLNRYGQPEEFGKLAAFLLSPVNSYMTGQTIFIDGGAIRSM